ncbi:zinc alcohol dehydrogenase [Hypomontagnella monticulosa]|nr:zinc alcohol dehydrogenase [Hypomontagnella monticulosa]
MRAWVAARPGHFRNVLELKTDWPTPAPPKTGEIMIKISYAALNPGNIKMIAFKIPFMRNAIVGLDFVGEIIQVGPSASPSNLRVGMIVGGSVPLSKAFRGVGALADYVVVPADSVAEKPPGLDESVAAGLLGVAGQTSVRLLRAANLRRGDRALVNGASGGVGTILIQALCGMGVKVTGICSAKNEALVRRLGAEEVVDYTAHESLYDHISATCATPGSGPFDAVFDCMGNMTLYDRSPEYLKPEGKFLEIEAGPLALFNSNNWWPVILGGTPRAFVNIFSAPSGASAQEAASWVEKGWIKEIPVDSTFEMRDALQGFEKLATKRAVGKVFVKVK